MKLETDSGLIEGHDACAAHFESLVADILMSPAQLDAPSQQEMLTEVPLVVTDEDNVRLDSLPRKQEIFEALISSNFKAAPGTDGISGRLYKEHWDIFGDIILDVVLEKHKGERLPTSMRTALMVFGQKPKKASSLKPKDRRRICILNSDFKLVESVYGRRFRKFFPHCLSKSQYVAGSDRNIHHGICRARDAIPVASQRKLPCGIADTDFIAAFDWLVLSWVWKVMLKFGVSRSVIREVQSLYEDSITITLVTTNVGESFMTKEDPYVRGDVPLWTGLL